MKKILIIVVYLVIGTSLYLLCYDYSKKIYPKEFYNVYLDGGLLGTIQNKESLDKYINDKTEHLINILEKTENFCAITPEVEKLISQSISATYYEKNNQKCVTVVTKAGTEVNNVFVPNGLEIEKILTFSGNINTIEEIYNKIVDTKSFTVKGYQFTIKDNENASYIYVTDKTIFEQATEELIKIFVGNDNYTKYLNKSQNKIETTGSNIENIYIQNDITVKETQIGIDSKIYTDYKELSQFLLYGQEPKTKTYKVKANEMIEDIALNNQISIQEFIISNIKYKDANSLINVGAEVQIKETSPQLKVVVETFVVEDKTNDYKTVYQYDDSKFVGYTETSQKGQKGLERISQSVQSINGLTIYVEPKGKETLKTSVDEIIIRGDKFVPNVGDRSNWAWPTTSGWTISDEYGWRYHPIYGKRQFHGALDIAGNGYNAPVYAANNGTIITRTYDSGFGNYIVIDHNNGYFTLYAHMNKFYNGLNVGSTVARGQQIGYVGSTGTSTGPHVHFEVWKDCKRCHISPWSLYK